MRSALYHVYDFEYRTLKELYGETNDEDGFEDYEDGEVIPPFQQFNPKRGSQPYAPTYTPQDEFGFAGLEPPVG